MVSAAAERTLSSTRNALPRKIQILKEIRPAFIAGTVWNRLARFFVIYLARRIFQMKKFAMLAAAILFAAAPALAAEKTWNGTIGDSKCNAKHSKAEHGSQTDSDHDCVNKCVGGGQKYVFVSSGKTYQIANQDFAGLKDHGGHKVALTGEMKGDSITVSKIDMPAEKPAAKKK